MEKRILVWDAPTRLFHWLLAASFAGAFLTGDSERWRDIHLLLGYTVAGLIGFRLVWGLIGTRYARFRSFLFSPREMLRYLRSLATALAAALSGAQSGRQPGDLPAAGAGPRDGCDRIRHLQRAWAASGWRNCTKPAPSQCSRSWACTSQAWS